MEYLEVLDEHGNLIGNKKLREEIHRDGDWHKTVHIWIMNENKEFLVQRRSLNTSSPNKLDISCAGHLKPDETSIKGAIRELKEELNIEVKEDDLKFINTLKRRSDLRENYDNREFTDLYTLHTNLSVEEMTFQKEEMTEIIYVSYEKFKEIVQNRKLLSEEDFNIVFEKVRTL